MQTKDADEIEGGATWSCQLTFELTGALQRVRVERMVCVSEFRNVNVITLCRHFFGENSPRFL